MMPSNSFIHLPGEGEGGEVFHKQINSMKDAVCSAVFQSLVRRVDEKRSTMSVRYYIRGGLGRAGLYDWPSVEASLVGDVGRHGSSEFCMELVSVCLFLK